MREGFGSSGRLQELAVPKFIKDIAMVGIAQATIGRNSTAKMGLYENAFALLGSTCCRDEFNDQRVMKCTCSCVSSVQGPMLGLTGE